jgi:soluble lytic murein transglycosylase-like protein
MRERLTMQHRAARGFVAALGIVGMLLIAAIAARAGGVPETCRPLQRTIEAEAFAAFGPNAPVPLFAAQIQQESACRADAFSAAGAQGLAQFMPATARDMARRYPRELGPADPYNTHWAIAAQVRYMRDLVRMPWRTDCDTWAAKLSAYNGGEGNLQRDQGMCRAQRVPDPDRCAPCADDRWWSNVELHSARSAAAFRENRGYPRRILLMLMPDYITAGYGRGIDCSEVSP